MPRSDLLNLSRIKLAVSDPEKLIGYCRVVTLIFSITAIYLDPTQPARFRSEAQLLLAFYLSAALLLLIFPVQRPVNSLLHLPVHVLDAAVLGWLAFLTNELTSPFFSFLPFVLISMTVRWGLLGAFAGAIILEITLLIIGVPDILDGESELNVLIMRAAYFFVAALMLGYFGAYRESNQRRLATLANWNTDFAGQERRDWIGSLFRHAAEVIGSRKLLVFWRHQDLPQGYLALLDDGSLTQFPIHDAKLLDDFEQSIESDDSSANARTTGSLDKSVIELLVQLDVKNPFVPVQHGYAAPFSSVGFRGYLWIFEPGCRPEDALMLSGIIARRISSELERIDLMEKLSANIRAEERSHLARDMHDSVLQDLTAASLKLRAASVVAPTVGSQIKEAEALLTQIQTRVRIFVEGPYDSAKNAIVAPSRLLRAHVYDLERQWGIDVNLNWTGEERPLPFGLVSGIQKLVSEATANAVRHGGADRMSVSTNQHEDKIELRISNNGAPLDRRVAPEGSRSLRTRAAELGSSMTILDSPSGFHMVFVIPTETFAHGC